MEAAAELGYGRDHDIFGAYTDHHMAGAAATDKTHPAVGESSNMVECFLQLMDPLPATNTSSHDSLPGSWTACQEKKHSRTQHEQPARIELGELAKASQRALITAARKNQLAVQVFGKPSLPGAWQGCPVSAWCSSPQDHLGPCNTNATIPGVAAYTHFMECMTDDEGETDKDNTHTSRGTHESEATVHGQADSSACTTHHHMEDASSTGCDGPALPGGLLSAFHSQHSVGPSAGHVRPRSVMRSASMATMTHPTPHALGSVREEPRAASVPATAAGSPMAGDLLGCSLWPPLSLTCSLHPFCLDESCPGATNVELLEAPDDVLDIPGCFDCDELGLMRLANTDCVPSASPIPNEQLQWPDLDSEHHMPPAAVAPRSHDQRRKALRATRSMPNFSKHGHMSGTCQQGVGQRPSLDCLLEAPSSPTAVGAQPILAGHDAVPPVSRAHDVCDTSAADGASFMIPVDMPGLIPNADLNKLLTEGFDNLVPSSTTGAPDPTAAPPTQQPRKPIGKPFSRLPEVPPPQISGNKKRAGPPVSTCARPVPNPRGPDVGCTACGSTVTPVWRAGPQGPKTLCNACGVRYMKVAKRR